MFSDEGIKEVTENKNIWELGGREGYGENKLIGGSDKSILER